MDKRYWCGATTCDICTQQIKGELYDAPTFSGQWGTMCATCWTQNSRPRLGIGYGQRYEEQGDGRFLKKEG